MRSDKLPQVMSLESASSESEDHKFENEKDLGVWSHQTSVDRSSSLLKASDWRLHMQLLG